MEAGKVGELGVELDQDSRLRLKEQALGPGVRPTGVVVVRIAVSVTAVIAVFTTLS